MENFKRLQAGEIGDYLMYKYRALASFHVWPEVCLAAMDRHAPAVGGSWPDCGVPNFNEFWGYHTFVELQHAHCRTTEEIVAAAKATMRHDIKKWLADGVPQDPSAYRLEEPAEFEFRLTAEGAREMRAALKVWGEELKGLTKMVTRINVLWQVRECHRLTPEKSFTQFA